MATKTADVTTLAADPAIADKIRKIAKTEGVITKVVPELLVDAWESLTPEQTVAVRNGFVARRRKIERSRKSA